MNKLGVMLTCYDEVDAVYYCVKEFRRHYPNTKIYIVTESKINYAKIFKKDKNILTVQDNDTMSFYCNNPTLHLTYKNSENQIKIKHAVVSFLNRVNSAISYTNSQYLLLMDPDVLIRGKLNIPENTKLLGSLTNKNVPPNINKIMESIEGAIQISAWGATPGIFDTKEFKKAYTNFFLNDNFLNIFSLEWPAFYAHDIIIPTIFALIGIPELYNNDFTECNTDPNWKNNNKVLVHHFKKYYPNVKEKFPWWSD